jgi:hypothetical protein
MIKPNPVNRVAIYAVNFLFSCQDTIKYVGIMDREFSLVAVESIPKIDDFKISGLVQEVKVKVVKHKNKPSV